MKWIIATCAIWLAGMAQATPVRITVSTDRLMAATQTHFYVLRDMWDNAGSHYAALHDQHLVEISLESGEATRFWPLRRMAVSHLATDDFLNPGQVTPRDGEVHDMMVVLAELGAQPLSPAVWKADDLTLQDGALMHEGEAVLTPFGIRAAGRAQLAILRDAYPPIETEAEYRRAERIDFYNFYAEGDWECVLQSEEQTLFQPKTKIRLVKLHCEDAEFSGAWSFHVLIKDNI